MKKILLAFALFLAAAPCMATDAITGDLLPQDQRAGTFNVDFDTKDLFRFSAQVNYSTNTVPSIQGWTAANLSLADDTFTIPAHGYGTGLGVLIATNTAPTGLTVGTTYYVIKVNDNVFKLANSSTGSVAGLALDITAAVSSNTYTFTPQALSLTGCGFTWLGSNDGTNYDSIGVSSQALTSTGTGYRLINFGEYAFRFVRFAFVKPTTGQISLRAIIYGKRME